MDVHCFLLTDMLLVCKQTAKKGHGNLKVSGLINFKCHTSKFNSLLNLCDMLKALDTVSFPLCSLVISNIIDIYPFALTFHTVPIYIIFFSLFLLYTLYQR